MTSNSDYPKVVMLKMLQWARGALTQMTVIVLWRHYALDETIRWVDESFETGSDLL